MKILIAKRKNINNFLKELDIECISTRDISRTYIMCSRKPYIEIDVVIRYGVITRLKANREINKASAIKLAANKLKTRQILLENNISCPKIVNKYEGNILIGRPIHHMAAKDFYVIRSQEDFDNISKRHTAYFQEYIDKDREYRVHVAHGKVLVVQEKTVNEDNRSDYAWNHSRGHIFQIIRWSEIPKGLLPLAVKSVEIIGLDFGAVDIIEKDNKFYVLEINTAPRLEGYTLEKYNKYFNWVIEKPREHFKNVRRYMMREEDYEDK